MVQKFNSLRSKPDIVISTQDYRRLSNLLAVQRHRFAETAFALQAELDRARIMPIVPSHVVQMGSTVEFRSDVAPQKPVTLVFPQEADISAARISILTPIGAALIGLSPGQSIHWETRDGAVRELAVIRVDRRATLMRALRTGPEHRQRPLRFIEMLMVTGTRTAPSDRLIADGPAPPRR